MAIDFNDNLLTILISHRRHKYFYVKKHFYSAYGDILCNGESSTVYRTPLMVNIKVSDQAGCCGAHL